MSSPAITRPVRRTLRPIGLLVGALAGRGFDAFLDKTDIAPGEPWKERLAGLIATADTVVIRVIDHGAGVPADDQERIFDRFVQLDASRRGRGSGLGLPIARWIAEAHGGALDLEATGPDGSTFRVSLPRA